MSFLDWFKSTKAKAFAFLGSFVMLLGVGASVSVAHSVMTDEAVETKASYGANHCLPTSDGRFYYRAYWNDNGWTKDDAKIWGYFWDNNGHTCYTSSCINVDDNLIYFDSGSNSSYYIVVPSDTSYSYVGAQLIRYDSDSSTTRGTEYNRTGNITFGASFNCVGPTSYGASYTVEKRTDNFFLAGATYYLDLSNGNYNWLADNHKIYGHLYTGDCDNAATDVQLTRVMGFPNEYLYQMVVPAASDYFRLIFHRGTTSSGYSNKTNALYKASNSVFKLTSYEGAGSWDWTLSDSERAGYFGKYFNANVVCDDKGSRTTDNWSDTQQEYETLATDIQGIVYTIVGDASGSDLERAMSKYDDVVYKHGKDRTDGSKIGIIDATHVDYVNRHVNGEAYTGGDGYAVKILGTPTGNESPLTMTLWIVLGCGIAGLGAIGTAYFVSKKKKRPQA